MSRLRQGMLERADDEPAHEARLAEPHLGLGRMDIHVDRLGRQVEEQRQHRVTVAGEEVLIGAPHRAEQQLVAHRPPVDEEILPCRGGAVEGRQPGMAGEAMALALGGDGERILREVAATSVRVASRLDMRSITKLRWPVE